MVTSSSGRHIDVFRAKAEAAGKPLPVSVSIGLDPAIYLGACFEPPMTPIGFNELAIEMCIRASVRAVRAGLHRGGRRQLLLQARGVHRRTYARRASQDMRCLLYTSRCV